MRGWKAISFKQFATYCRYASLKDGNWVYTACNDPNTHYSRCSACICLPWRKLGRADIKVSKITKHNSG